MQSDSRSPEYRETLCAVIEALLAATADERLPDLSSGEIHHWFTHLTLADVSNAYDSLLIKKAAAATEELPDPEAVNATIRQVCAGCGTPISATAKFCPECGRTVAGTLRCINCNTPIQPDANFCSACGFRVSIRSS